MPFAWSVRSLHPRDCPRGVERSDRRALTALGADQCRGSAARHSDRSLSSRQRDCLRRRRLPGSKWLRFCRDDRGRLAAWTDATERRPVYDDDRDGSRRAGVERAELARVPWAIDRAFLARLARHGSLRVEALEFGYSATFPLAGFRRAPPRSRYIARKRRED